MHTSLARARRALAALAVGAALLALDAARPARAWEYPLLPHVQGLAFFPERPNSASHTYAQLSAVYPNECWALVDTISARSSLVLAVGVTIAPRTDCGDTVSTWVHTFDLGMLAAGTHHLKVQCTVLYADQPPGQEEILVPFDVVDAPPPPPPPPPATLPLLEIISGTEALPGAPVTLTLSGFTPFECTLIHNENATQDSVFAAFDPLPSCADTSRRWARSFDLGSFPEGDHPVAIQLFVNVPDSAYTYGATAVVRVHPSAPPPPPIDSSAAGLSSSHPNPFREQSSFSVSLDQAQAADVAVFDLLGRRVVTIHHGVLPQGTSQLAWNGRRQDGSRAPGGVYFYRLTLPNRVVHRQVVLLGTP